MRDHLATIETARRALLEAGVVSMSDPLHGEMRDELCLIRLPDERVAWFATSHGAKRLLALERRLLHLVRTRSHLAVPEVTFVSADACFDVRTLVPGLVDAQAVFERASRDEGFANDLGHQIGALLAELHASLTLADVDGWLPRSLEWPLPRRDVVKSLEKVVGDKRLIIRANEVLRTYENLAVHDRDLAVVHGDIGFHNLAFDPQTLDLRGIFDFKSAAFADCHLDFRYLTFDLGRSDLLEAACLAYSERSGKTISRERVLLHNAVWAISFLAHRSGTQPDELSCGRTLEADLRWTRAAIAQVLDLGMHRKQV